MTVTELEYEPYDGVTLSHEAVLLTFQLSLEEIENVSCAPEGEKISELVDTDSVIGISSYGIFMHDTHIT
jgi:hypothetical protein